MRFSEEEAAEILARVQRNKTSKQKTAVVRPAEVAKPACDISSSAEESKVESITKGSKTSSKRSISSGDEKICEIDKLSGEIRITIPVAPVTKKNHGNIISFGPKCSMCGKGKYTKLLPSKAYSAYEKEISPYIEIIHNIVNTIDYPINLKCLFYCKKRYKGDLVGYLQAIQDILVGGEVLKDDNRNIVAATDGSRVFHDSAYPRTEITISRLDDYEQWNSKKAPHAK